MIRIRHLSKQFPGNVAPALHDLSLDIEAGTFFTLFGPSGCGKSTLLRCVAGLETADTGEIEISGATVFSAAKSMSVPPNQRRIGMVFQSYAIWPHMTVLQNVAFPLEVQRKPNPQKGARDALDIVGLSALADRYASKLSGGQQQRVALARAIVADPAVLLLDEPLSNLDAALRDQMRAELQALHRRLGITAIYVTHDQTEALSMSDRIAVMREGRFVEIGTPQDLFAAPSSAFTARLIGGANVIDGTAGSAGGGLTRLESGLGPLLSTSAATGRAQAFIRPERIAIHATAPGNAVNTFRAMIKERRFGGESTELDLVPEGAGAAIVLRSRVPTAQAPAAGTAVSIVIDPADVRIFPTEGD
jgi:iron(III) transport system ATP-binding protein